MDKDGIINHLGEQRSLYFDAVAPPILQTSNFCFPDVASFRAAVDDELATPFYTRGNNPTVKILREKLAALASMEDALVVGSGSAAMSLTVLNYVRQGDHVVCIEKPYTWTNKLLINLLERYGVSHTFVSGTSPEDFESAIQSNTRLIILESPNSITFEVLPVAEICKVAQKYGIKTILDNSYCTPIGFNASEAGVDIEVHSASKYFGGHSDIVAGIILGSKKDIRSIFENTYMNIGAIISPNDAWLLLRSLRTLPIRIKHISENTMQVVNFLMNHPKVKQVLHPLCEQHPQHESAKEQFAFCGGLFSIILETEDIAKIESFVNHLKHFLIACSWGGHESLVLPACAVQPLDSTNPVLPMNLVRLYCGLDEPETLIDDLSKGLALL